MNVFNKELLRYENTTDIKVLVVQEAWSLLKLFGEIQDLEIEPDNADDIRFSIVSQKMREYAERQNNKRDLVGHNYNDDWEPCIEDHEEDIVQVVNYYRTPSYYYGGGRYEFYFDQLPQPSEIYWGVGYVALHNREIASDSELQTIFRLPTHPRGIAIIDDDGKEIDDNNDIWDIFDLLGNLKRNM